MALGHHIGDTHDFENSAHRATGNDAGTGRRRAQNNAARAEFAHHIMMQRTAFTHRHADHAALGAFRRLADRFRHFARLTSTPANAALFITHNNQCCEAEATTTLYHLRDAIDGNQLVLQFIAFLTISARFAFTITPATTTAFTALAAFTTVTTQVLGSAPALPTAG